MKLQALVKQANATYDLELGEEETADRMRRAGFGSEVSASNVERALNEILSISETPTGPNEIYASLKTEAAPQPSGDKCPRCQAQMVTVALVNSRNATYCQPCSITLPIKAKE